MTATRKGKRHYAGDRALQEFDGHVLRLLQMIRKPTIPDEISTLVTGHRAPKRFAKTGVSAAHLMRLSAFLIEVADGANTDKLQ